MLPAFYYLPNLQFHIRQRERISGFFSEIVGVDKADSFCRKNQPDGMRLVEWSGTAIA